MIKNNHGAEENSKKEHGARKKSWSKRKNKKGAGSTEKLKRSKENRGSMLLAPPPVPYSFQYFASCSFLTLFLAPFSFLVLHAPFYFFLLLLDFFLLPASFSKEFCSAPCSYLSFLLLVAPGLPFIQLLPASLSISLLAPCSFVSHRACSLLRDYP